MDLVDRLTDGTYFLVHLFKENEDYLEKAMTISKDRHVILDNSVFELETEFDSNEFAHWIDLTRPTEYIIPDVLEDKDSTIENVILWNENFGNQVPGKTIGVVQGKTYQEVVECYKAIEPLVDKVAISFDYCFYKDLISQQIINATIYEQGYLLDWTWGRQALLKRLYEDKIINVNKKHHLLGCGLYSEFSAYADYNWIDSVDTSSPVMWAMEKKLYTDAVYKPKQKLFTLIDFVPKDKAEDLAITVPLVTNINTFNRECNG